MILRELLGQIVQNKLNLDAEIVFVNAEMENEQFTGGGIIDYDDKLIRFG